METNRMNRRTLLRSAILSLPLVCVPRIFGVEIKDKKYPLKKTMPVTLFTTPSVPKITVIYAEDKDIKNGKGIPTPDGNDIPFYYIKLRNLKNNKIIESGICICAPREELEITIKELELIYNTPIYKQENHEYVVVFYKDRYAVSSFDKREYELIS